MKRVHYFIYMLASFATVVNILLEMLQGLLKTWYVPSFTVFLNILLYFLIPITLSAFVMMKMVFQSSISLKSKLIFDVLGLSISVIAVLLSYQPFHVLIFFSDHSLSAFFLCLQFECFFYHLILKVNAHR